MDTWINWFTQFITEFREATTFGGGFLAIVGIIFTFIGCYYVMVLPFKVHHISYILDDILEEIKKK